MADCAKCDIDHRRGSTACPGQRVDRTVAGRYRIVRLLGMGGMGAVYEAEHLQLKRRVALKMMHSRLSEAPEIAARFQREAREAAALGHAGIVEVRDLGHDSDGSLYLEMELLEGTGVDELVRQGPLPIARAVEITRQVLDALETAHDKGVIHRDLKPENLFIARTPKGEVVKILDFGLAKVLADTSEPGVTNTGVVLGTPVYMSPDQFRDAKRVDQRGDVYSLGATLFAMLTGQPPVGGSSVSDVLYRLAQGEVSRHPRALRPEVPEWLDALVAKSLAHAPEARFPTAREMRLALEAGRGVEEVALSSTVAKDPTSSKAVTTERKLPTRIPWGAAIGTVLGVAALGGWLWAARTLPPQLPPPAAVDLAPATAAVPEGLIAIPGATYPRGSTSEEIDAAFAWCKTLAGPACRRALYEREQPRGEVTVKPFFIDRTEVTNEAFAAWLGRAGVAQVDGRFVKLGETLLGDIHPASSGIDHAGGYRARPGLEGKPAVQVTWNGAKAYCAARGARLPSEAEWELAARGAAGRRFPWGAGEPGCAQSALSRNKGQPCAALGAGPVNTGATDGDVTPEGVRDLGGNVAEWVDDAFAERYDAAPSAELRVVRGGTFDGLAESARAAGRSRLKADGVAVNIGFRCAKSLP